MRREPGPPPLWLIGAVGALVMLAVSGIAWSHVSEPMAVHFGSTGPDGFAGKSVGLLTMPVTVLLGTALMIAAARYQEWRRPRSRDDAAIALIWLAAVTLLAGIHVSMVAIAL